LKPARLAAQASGGGAGSGGDQLFPRKVTVERGGCSLAEASSARSLVRGQKLCGGQTLELAAPSRFAAGARDCRFRASLHAGLALRWLRRFGARGAQKRVFGVLVKLRKNAGLVEHMARVGESPIIRLGEAGAKASAVHTVIATNRHRHAPAIDMTAGAFALSCRLPCNRPLCTGF